MTRSTLSEGMPERTESASPQMIRFTKGSIAGFSQEWWDSFASFEPFRTFALPALSFTFSCRTQSRCLQGTGRAEKIKNACPVRGQLQNRIRIRGVHQVIERTVKVVELWGYIFLSLGR